MNTLIPAAPGRRSSVGDIGDVVLRSPDPEREVAMHAPRGARDLVGERRGGGRRRIGVGHFEHGGDAAQDRRARAGLQILLVGQAGLAEMDLAVDHAGQDMQAAAIQALARRSGREIADLGDLAVDDADVALSHAVLVDDGRVGENAIEQARHPGRFLPCAAARSA